LGTTLPCVNGALRFVGLSDRFTRGQRLAYDAGEFKTAPSAWTKIQSGHSSPNQTVST